MSDPKVILQGLPVIVLIILILFVGTGGKKFKKPTSVPSPTPTIVVTPTVLLRCERYDRNENVYRCEVVSE